MKPIRTWCGPFRRGRRPSHGEIHFKGGQRSSCPTFGQGDRQCAKNAMKDSATAITDLMKEIENLELMIEIRDSSIKRYQEAVDLYKVKYEKMIVRAEAAEARVLELETTHRTEICEDGYDCAELARARKRVQEAETRAEKAEKELAEYHCRVCPIACKGNRCQWYHGQKED